MKSRSWTCVDVALGVALSPWESEELALCGAALSRFAASRLARASFLDSGGTASKGGSQSEGGMPKFTTPGRLKNLPKLTQNSFLLLTILFSTLAPLLIEGLVLGNEPGWSCVSRLCARTPQSQDKECFLTLSRNRIYEQKIGRCYLLEEPLIWAILVVLTKKALRLRLRHVGLPTPCARNLILGKIFGMDGNEYIHEYSPERDMWAQEPRTPKLGLRTDRQEFKTFGDCQ